MVGLSLSPFMFRCADLEDDDSESYAEALYPYISMINHSCEPNCEVEIESGYLIRMLAIRGIQPNDEVNISYVDTSWDRNSRRHHLKKYHLFDCMVRHQHPYVSPLSCSHAYVVSTMRPRR